MQFEEERREVWRHAGRTSVVAVLDVALSMESCARVYVQALAIGEPVRLPDSAITAGRALFESRRQAGADRIAGGLPGLEPTEKS